MTTFEKWRNRLSHEERLAIAESKTAKLLDLGIELINYHASNRIILFSNVLGSQIPQSYAGHAFHFFRRGLFEIEVIKLARLWDRPGQHTYSIPSVWSLVRDSNFQEFIKQRHFTADAYGDNANELTRRWSRLNRLLSRDGENPLRLAVANFRHKHLAHFLEQTYDEEKGVTFRTVVYGDERRLLYRTLSVINVLDLAVRRSGFNWKESCKMARRNAEALWHGCTFKVLE